MDDKTEQLRDIFVSVTDEDTVTESQEQSRGSIARETVDSDRIEELIATMRERYGFETELADEALCSLVVGFYDGERDGEIADELDVDRETVFRARLDLHLLRDRDTDAPFDFDAFRRAVAQEESTADLADTFDVADSTIRRYRRILAARNESRQANDRYRDEFDSILGDADISSQLATDVQEDGLEDATEGMETDVSF